MISIVDLSKLRREISAYECTCFEDLRIFSYQMIVEIRALLVKDPEMKDPFFKTYIDHVVLPNLSMLKDFLKENEEREDRLEFKVRSLKYHFHFVIDSCIYATMVNHKK